MPIKGSNGGYFYNSPLRVQTSKNTFPPYTPFINGQDPLNGKEPFNHFYLQRTGGLNGERQQRTATAKGNYISGKRCCLSVFTVFIKVPLYSFFFKKCKFLQNVTNSIKNPLGISKGVFNFLICSFCQNNLLFF